jgi:hypothetical protein
MQALVFVTPTAEAFTLHARSLLFSRKEVCGHKVQVPNTPGNFLDCFELRVQILHFDFYCDDIMA